MILGLTSLGLSALGSKGTECTGGMILGIGVLGASVLGSVCGASLGAGPEADPVVSAILYDVIGIGEPSAYAEPYQIPIATISGSGPIGDPNILAHEGEPRKAIMLVVGPIAAPSSSVRVYPRRATGLPVATPSKYFCILTGASDGLPDAMLPISSFSVRHRVESDSHYQISIPTLSVIDYISERPNGQILITMVRGDVTEEVMRGALGSIRIDRGAGSQSISISGNSSRAATERRIYIPSGVSYIYTTFAGEYRIRFEPRAAIRPGDTIEYQGNLIDVGEVSWSVQVSKSGLYEQMEVTTA